jgi:hypothetical protein
MLQRSGALELWYNRASLIAGKWIGVRKNTRLIFQAAAKLFDHATLEIISDKGNSITTPYLLSTFCNPERKTELLFYIEIVNPVYKRFLIRELTAETLVLQELVMGAFHVNGKPFRFRKDMASP